MKYRQTRTYGAFGLSYDFEYQYERSPERIQGTFALDATDEWNSIDTPPDIDLKNGLEGEIETITTEGRALKLSIKITNPSDIEDIGKFLIDVVDQNQSKSETLHIKIPSAYLLKLYDHLLQDEVAVRAHDQLNDILKNEGNIDIFEVLNSAPFAISRSKYYELMDRIVAYDESLENLIRDQILTDLIDWIRGDASGRYYSIDTISELQEETQKYNSYNNTPVVEEPVLDPIILSREEHIGRGLDGFLVDNFGREEFPYSELSNESYILVIGYLVEELDLGDLITNFSSHSKNLDSFDIENCLAKSDGNQFGCLRSCLPDFVSQSNPDSVRYGIGHLIRSYLFEFGDNLDNQTQAYLYRSVISLCDNSSVDWMSEHARHHRHLKLADDARESDPERARRHYDRAIVVLTQSENWEYTANEHIWAVFRKTLHEVDMLEEDGLYGEAVDTIADREELIQDIGNAASNSMADNIIIQLNGHRHEVRANKFLEKDQFERAQELYNQAAGLYKESGRESLFRGVKGREIEITALLSELSGDFQDASSHHERYVDLLPDSAGSKFHKIRSEICLIKSKATNGQYSAALEQLNKIEQEYYTTLQPAQDQFRYLLQAAQAFQQNQTEELEGHFQALISSLEGGEDRLLNFSDDYSTGHLTVLAAQRLQSLPVDQQELENMVDLAIKDACFPKAPEEHITALSEAYASPTVGGSREWELALPSHIVHQLDQLRIDKQTTFDEFASLVRQLGVITEELLVIIREYHAKQLFGEDWESLVPGTGDPTVGDLYQFFKSDAGQNLNSADDVVELFESELVGEELIKELRNALSHGRNPQIANEPYRQINEEQFETIYDAVTRVFRVVTTDLPVLGMVGSQLSPDTYKIRLEWGGLPKQIWITTEYDLDVGELYIFPREEFDEDHEKTVTIPSELIEPCTSDARTHY